MYYSWLPAVTLNSFGVLILLVPLASIKLKRRNFILPDERVFLWMLLVNIIILIFDACTYLLDGQVFKYARELNTLVTTLYYLLNPVMSFLYMYYCQIKTSVPNEKFRKSLPLLLLPIIIHTVLVFLSPRYSLLFHLSADNVYSRGSVFFLSFLLSYILLIIVFIRTLKSLIHTKENKSYDFTWMDRRNTMSLLFFPIPQLIGGLIQIWLSEITLIWLSSIFSLLIIFISIQNVEIYTDHLTGLYNRRKTDVYLSKLIISAAKGDNICLIILDLDDFKHINDYYGHLAGDEALKTTASVIQEKCNKSDFISRYGGDEFIVISRNCSEVYVKRLVDDINAGLTQQQKLQNLPYTLTVTAGYSFWSENYIVLDDLISGADAMLYHQKSKNPNRQASE